MRSWIIGHAFVHWEPRQFVVLQFVLKAYGRTIQLCATHGWMRDVAMREIESVHRKNEVDEFDLMHTKDLADHVWEGLGQREGEVEFCGYWSPLLSIWMERHFLIRGEEGYDFMLGTSDLCFNTFVGESSDCERVAREKAEGVKFLGLLQGM